MHLQPIWLLDKEEILERAISVEEYKSDTRIFRNIKGVYFLIQDDEIVYVGSTSRSIRMRVWKHEVPHDKIYAQDLPDEYLYRAMEILYIGELSPRFNKVLY